MRQPQWFSMAHLGRVEEVREVEEVRKAVLRWRLHLDLHLGRVEEVCEVEEVRAVVRRRRHLDLHLGRASRTCSASLWWCKRVTVVVREPARLPVFS